MIDDTIKTAIAMQDAECYDDDIIGDADEDEDIDLGSDDDDRDDAGDGEW